MDEVVTILQTTPSRGMLITHDGNVPNNNKYALNKYALTKYALNKYALNKYLPLSPSTLQQICSRQVRYALTKYTLESQPDAPQLAAKAVHVQLLQPLGEMCVVIIIILHQTKILISLQIFSAQMLTHLI